MSNEIADAIEYFPETGLFVWKISPSNCVTAGRVAGSVDNKGYWNIQYRGRKYKGHRLAWFLMTGYWPVAQIDHRDLDKSNNRYANLRAATNAQNRANSKPRGQLPKGVCRNGKRFVAQITICRKNHYLGSFKTSGEAALAYSLAAKQHFGEFARTA